ncbi:MAG: sulfurtransferase [Pseudomonadota bacterium]|nr:sulfurtransferase [Pseudomonadota bacterium]
MQTTIVTTAELAAHPEWRVFDCRNDLGHPERGPELYGQGHIPGAVHAHLEHHLSGAKTGTNGRHPLPDPRHFAAWLGAQGLKADDQVVAYDSAGTSYAARLWWLLGWIGHPAVAVLDGGWDKWLRDGRPVTTQVPAFEPAVFDTRPDDSLWVDSTFVAKALGAGRSVVIDARAEARYSGDEEPLDPVAGHIPGARNRPYTANLDSQGLFKSPELLRGELLAMLEPASSTVVSQCGSGVTACHNILAMRIAGLEPAKLYPGSWSEWCSDPARPITKGTAP